MTPQTQRGASATATSHTGTRTRASRSTLRGSTGSASGLTRAAGVGLRSWRAVARASRGAAAWVANTVTPVGWFAVVVCGSGLYAGFAWGWMEALAVGSAAGILILVSTLFLLGSKLYEVELTLDDDRVVAGESSGFALTVTNPHRRLILPTRVEIPVGPGLAEVTLPVVLPGGTVTKHLELPNLRRGVLPVGPVRAIKGDPVGIMRRTMEFTQRRTLWVHPQVVTLPNATIGSIRDLDGVPSSTIVSSDVSFHALREYQPGDPQRNVHWKSTAKTGVLMVRQYEESRRSTQAVVLSRAEADYANDEEFELAVSAAASLGVQGIRFGRDTAVSVSPLIPEFATTPPRQLSTLPATNIHGLLDAASGVQRHPRGARLAQTAELTGALVERMSVAFLVAGTGATVAEMQAAALRMPVDVTVVIVLCDPLSRPRMQRIGSVDVFVIALIDDLMQLARRSIR